MCSYSMIANDWTKRIGEKYPPFQPYVDGTSTQYIYPQVTKEEFDALKKEMEAIKKLLKAAKIYDEEVGLGGCETESKIQLLRDLAEHLGVDLSDAIPDHLA